MTDIVVDRVVVAGHGVRLDRMLAKRDRARRGLVELALAINPGLADCGGILPVGRAVDLPKKDSVAGIDRRGAALGLIVVPFRISVAGTDVSERLRPILEELSVTDKAGTVSDTASVTLNDIGGSIVLPRRDANLSVALPSKGSLVEVFRGTVDDVRSKYDRGAGLKLLIEAKGMNTRDELKAPREEHWDDKDLASVMQEVGEMGGISIRVADVFASIRRDWWAMDGESIPPSAGGSPARSPAHSRSPDQSASSRRDPAGFLGERGDALHDHSAPRRQSALGRPRARIQAAALQEGAGTIL